MAISDSRKWSQVVAKSAGMKVVTAARSRHEASTISSDILFELPEFSQQQIARKAAAIIRQALSPDSVLFQFPIMTFSHRTEAYKVITDQIGPLASVRPLSNYDVRARKDLLIAAKFTCTEQTNAAIETGVTIDDVVYKAMPTITGAENPLVRVQLNLLHNADDRDLKEDLLSSLRYYGKVYQIRRHLCNGYFEGQLTVTLDPSEGYMDDQQNKRESQPLQRMLYLDAWDVFAPASFKGAAPICYYCRQAGHIRNACPELAKRVCFECGHTGHTKRFCREQKEESVLIQEYEDKRKSQHVQQEDNTSVKQITRDKEDQTLNSSLSEESAHEQDVLSEVEFLDNVPATREDKDEMDVDTTNDNVEKREKKTPVDPSESVYASIHAPITVATHMRVDSQTEMLNISSVTPSTKAKRDKAKRSLLKPTKLLTPHNKAASLSVNPVIPKPNSSDIARRAQ